MYQVTIPDFKSIQIVPSFEMAQAYAGPGVHITRLKVTHFIQADVYPGGVNLWSGKRYYAVDAALWDEVRKSLRTDVVQTW